jgi:hypothetical protein
MPRYFFHIEDGTSRLDEEGVELPSPHAARVEAARVLAELVKDDPEDFWANRSMKLIVTDRPGLILFVLDLSAVEAPAVRRQA